jgi:glycosyltransferase involved in cell wall biosynthesis
MSKDISVLIPTWNRCELLQRTLPTVLQQDFPADRFEVIVAADGCTDNTAAYVRQLKSNCELRLTEIPHRGRAAALNAALAEARGEIVLFLDDDLLCPPTLLRRHCQAHVDGVALLGAVTVAGGSPLAPDIELRRRGLAAYFAQSPHSRPLHFGQANSSVARSRLLDVGGFDPDFVGTSEEADCGFRLWKAGVRFAFAPQAGTREIYNLSCETVVSRARDHGANEWRLCLKHPDYRPYSRLQQALHGSPWRQRLRRFAVESPLDHLELVSIVGAAQHLSRVDSAVRFLGASMALAFFRGAVAEAGSWRKMLAHLQDTEKVVYPSFVPRKPAEQIVLRRDRRRA